MRAPHFRPRPFLVLLGLAAVLMAGCTDTETVFVERPIFPDPPEGAEGYLGYDTASTKLTVCGNCHIGQQAQWAMTGHAEAWKGLQDSGHAQSFCNGCHTVGANGHASDIAGGYETTSDPRYHDVQCESCHSGGLGHVLNPDGTQPQASIAIFNPLTGEATENCAECHSGAHHPFADEWAQSPHSEATQTVVDRAISNPERYSYCLSCHSGNGALAAWGVKANFQEKNDGPADHVGITCAVCHDPHNATNAAQLRFPHDVPDISQNLCMKCHNRRGTPDPGSSRGPHAPEGPLLLAEAGWQPPGFPDPGTLLSAHSGGGNPQLCAGCHVNSYEITDPVTNEFVFNSTGHLFLAIPCLDENGIPLPEAECPDSERDFSACAACHTGPDEGRNIYNQTLSDVAAKVQALRDLLAQVPATEFDTSDGVTTTAEGADFNADLGDHTGSAVHNGVYLKALLDASIAQVQADYGL